MSTRYYLLILVIAIVVSYAYGRYNTPVKIVTKTVIETKTVEVVHHDIQTVIKEVTKPDGTKEVTTTITDKSVDNTDTNQTVDQTKVVSNEKPQWKVNAGFTPHNPALGYFYSATIERRILGPIFLGVQGNTDRNVALTVGLEF